MANDGLHVFLHDICAMRERLDLSRSSARWQVARYSAHAVKLKAGSRQTQGADRAFYPVGGALPRHHGTGW